jgi:hypothetical protein
MTADPALEMAYPPGRCHDLAPWVKHLTPTYHLLHKILCHTISVKQGDKSQIRGWLINTLHYLEKGKRLDIMYYIYEEMRTAVIERKCCILAPYIQLLIQDKIGAPLLRNTRSLTIDCFMFSPTSMLKILPLGAPMSLLLLSLPPLVDPLIMVGRLS